MTGRRAGTVREVEDEALGDAICDGSDPEELIHALSHTEQCEHLSWFSQNPQPVLVMTLLSP